MENVFFGSKRFYLDEMYLYFRDYPLIKGKVIDATVVVDNESGLHYTKYIVSVNRKEGIELW